MHKLFEVNSSKEVYGFMEQFTAFEMVLEKYVPKNFRNEGEGLRETIDEYTTGVIEKYGDEISDEISDIVDMPETNEKVSTKFDDIKFAQNINVKSTEVFVGSNVVIKNYYDMDRKDNMVIEYKQGDLTLDFNTNYYLYTSWIKLKEDYSPIYVTFNNTAEDIPVEKY